jgi:hypothetical protein
MHGLQEKQLQRDFSPSLQRKRQMEKLPIEVDNPT